MSFNLTPSEQLTHSTVRINCRIEDGTPSTGSGFFYMFAKHGTQGIPAIVTNKHVVAGAVDGWFSLTVKAEDGSPVVGNHVRITLDQFEDRWIPHADPNVDLCAMPIGPLLRQAEATGQLYFFVSLDESLLPSQAELGELGALEDILKHSHDRVPQRNLGCDK